jgi:hypothetical protein
MVDRVTKAYNQMIAVEQKKGERGGASRKSACTTRA